MIGSVVVAVVVCCCHPQKIARSRGLGVIQCVKVLCNVEKLTSFCFWALDKGHKCYKSCIFISCTACYLVVNIGQSLALIRMYICYIYAVHMTCLTGVWLIVIMYYNISISICFHIKSLAVRVKLIMMNEGSLDWCTLLYPFSHVLRVLAVLVHM